MATTAWINDSADAIVDKIIKKLEQQPFTRIKKGEFISATLTRALWNQLPEAEQTALLSKHPEIKQALQ
jgi:hypothetical protein